MEKTAKKLPSLAPGPQSRDVSHSSMSLHPENEERDADYPFRKPGLQSWVEIAGLLILLAVNALFLKRAMLFQFDPNDYGGLLDITWRIYNGQKPYIDFIYHLQPLFLYVMTGFAVVFGFGKAGVLAQLITISSGMIMASFFLVRGRIPSYAALLVTALTTVGFYWHYPFPTFTHDAFFYATLGVLALSRTLPLSKRRTAFFSGFACAAAAALAFMTKPNIGIPFGMLFLLSLALENNRKYSISGYVAGGLSVMLLCLPLIHDPERFLFHTTAYISTQQGRLSNLLHISRWFANGYWIFPAIVFPNISWKEPRTRNPAILFAGAVVTAIFVFNTSSFTPLAHIPMMGVCAGLGWLLLQKAGRDAPLRRKIVPVLMTAAILAQMGQSGFYACRIAAGHQHPNPLLNYDYEIQTEPLKGWHCIKIWGEPMDEIVRFVNTSVPKEDSLLIISPMQIVYALTRRQSYRNIPFQFVIPIAPAPGRQMEEVRKAILANPPRWLITHRDRGPFPINSLLPYMGLQDFVLGNYDVVRTWGPYAILKKRG